MMPCAYKSLFMNTVSCLSFRLGVFFFLCEEISQRSSFCPTGHGWWWVMESLPQISKLFFFSLSSRCVWFVCVCHLISVFGVYLPHRTSGSCYLNICLSVSYDCSEHRTLCRQAQRFIVMEKGSAQSGKPFKDKGSHPVPVPCWLSCECLCRCISTYTHIKGYI